MKLKNKYLSVTCDGGAATGKSTGAKLIAKKFNLSFLSSGLLYRYASYLIIKHTPRNKLSFLKKNLNILIIRNLKRLIYIHLKYLIKVQLSLKN